MLLCQIFIFKHFCGVTQNSAHKLINHKVERTIKFLLFLFRFWTSLFLTLFYINGSVLFKLFMLLTTVKKWNHQNTTQVVCCNLRFLDYAHINSTSHILHLTVLCNFLKRIFGSVLHTWTGFKLFILFTERSISYRSDLMTLIWIISGHRSKYKIWASSQPL